MIKFSIIVPVYNMEDHIVECIESIRAQNYRNYEIIIINDGSTDKTLKICLQYEEKDKKIIVINQNNSGVSKSRNEGIKRASGEYIIFIDGDDKILPNTLDKLKNEIERYNPELIIYGLSFDVYKNNILVKSTASMLSKSMQLYDEEIKEKFGLIYNSTEFASVCNKCFSHSVIKKNNLNFNESMNTYEDLYFNLNFIEKCKLLVNIPNILYNYRCISGTNYIKKRKDKNYIDYCEMILDKFENVSGHYETKEFNSIMIQLYDFTIKSYLTNSQSISNKEGIKFIKNISKSKWYAKFINISKDISVSYRVMGILINFKLYFLAYLFLKKIIK